MTDACPKIYEDVIWQQLVSIGRVHWQKRIASTSFGGAGTSTKMKDVDDWQPFSVKLPKVVDGAIPKYEDMKLNVLYVSSSTTFPFVKAVVKLKGGKLVGFRVTRQAKTSAELYDDSTIVKFIEKVGLTDLSNFTFVLIPRPGMADTSFLQLSKNSAFKDELLTHVVWKVPADYTSDGRFDSNYNK